MSDFHVPPEKMQHVAELAHALADAIQGGDRQQILAAQAALTEEARYDWDAVQQQPNLTPKDKALARLLADMALKELPDLIQDPANYPQILGQLRLLKNSMALL